MNELDLLSGIRTEKFKRFLEKFAK